MLDLGRIDDPLFVFGGPYSNIQATEAVLERAREQGFSASRIICTGDVVAYCANPVETTTAIRQSGIHVVMGNCEESLGFDRGDCGCGFTEDSACDVLSRQWFDFASQRITADDKAWMRALPRQISFEMAGQRFTVVHGSPSQISGWVFGSTAQQVKNAEMDEAACDGMIAGHCGLPFISTTEDHRMWFNAGVIGMPANDGTPRGWYGIVQPGDGDGIQMRMEPFDYDHDAAARAMQNAGLADGYAKALVTGLWPNMDVLPEKEKHDQGRALEAQTHRWPGAQKSRLIA
jgi:predicted phosphodiesterase